MTFNNKIIDEILNSIFPLPEQFGLIDNNEPIDIDYLEDTIRKVDNSAYIEYGASKMVIISPNFGNVVIKIPFNGHFEETYYGDLEWYPFEYATGSNISDYCLAEYEKYKKLKTYGLDCFVAKVIYYKTLYGKNIFLQEFVDPLSEIWKSPLPSDNSKDIAEKWKEERKFRIDTEWIANCIDKYGESKVKRFLHYCSNIDLDIFRDIHRGNFGYRKNDTPAILDFSSYEE